ncbi:hypothetical protein AB0N48_21190 [Micromonospora chalcea]|uniref:hypothetical protein n=1 Tax=Micromonospora TaxID=1873 RepID=UPI00114D1D23|nr:hypothetical protein [Micromonospora sp. II]
MEIVIEVSEEEALLGLRDDLRAIGSLVNADAVMQSSIRNAPALHPSDSWTPKSTLDPAAAVLLVGASLQAVRMVANVVSHWIERQRARTVTLSVGTERLEIKSASAAHQAAVIEAWLGKSASKQASIQQAEDA